MDFHFGSGNSETVSCLGSSSARVLVAYYVLTKMTHSPRESRHRGSRGWDGFGVAALAAVCILRDMGVPSQWKKSTPEGSQARRLVGAPLAHQ